MSIPNITDELTRFPDCCASISKPLLDKLAGFLPRSPQLTLSVGSGSGLFEALLQKQNPLVYIEGAEVSEGINRYLSDDCVNVVGGTWDVCEKISVASALMFIYPKDPEAVRRHIEAAVHADCVIWLGPQADWEVFEKAAFADVKREMNMESLDRWTVPYERLIVYQSSQRRV